MQLSVRSIKDYSKYLTTTQRLGSIPTIDYKATLIDPNREQTIIFDLSGTDLDNDRRRLSLDLNNIGNNFFIHINTQKIHMGNEIFRLMAV